MICYLIYKQPENFRCNVCLYIQLYLLPKRSKSYEEERCLRKGGGFLSSYSFKLIKYLREEGKIREKNKHALKDKRKSLV